MTARSSRLWSVLYSTETEWGETSTDVVGTRLRILNQPQLNVSQERIVQPFAQQSAEEGFIGVKGEQGGGFTIELPLSGLGSVQQGAIVATDLMDLLEIVVGNLDATMSGDSIASVVDAGEFSPTTQTYDTHKLVRVGALGDGRAEGQAVAVDAGGTMTLLTDAPAAPNTADRVYAMAQIFPSEGANSGDIQSTRWRIQSSNGQWLCRGCYPTGLSFSGLTPGQQPTVSITFAVSSWEPVNETFPAATVAESIESSTVGGGSMFMANVGTSARGGYCPVDFTLNIEFETQISKSLCGSSEYQTVVAATRTRTAASFDVTFDAEAAGTTTFMDIWDDGTPQHVLMTLNAAPGRAVAFYFPNAHPVGNRPTQVDVDGLNRVAMSFRAYSDDTFTTESQAASWNLALG